MNNIMLLTINSQFNQNIYSGNLHFDVKKYNIIKLTLAY